MKENSRVKSFNCSLVGFGYFISRPYLWLGPIAAALLAFIIMVGVFIFVTYFSWPKPGSEWLHYSWGIMKSFGYGSISVLALWVSIFPIILNVAFEKMCGKILHEKKREVKGEGTSRAVVSSIHVVFRTLGWRIFWPVISVIALIFMAPLAILLVQIGMGHIAIIDGCDLSLSVQGVGGGRRIKMLKERTALIFGAGVVAGILSMVLTTTFIGWVFWLPGVYAGTVLWTMTWSAPESRAPTVEKSID